MTSRPSAPPDDRRVLHVVRGERGRRLCTPAPGDRVVDLADSEPTALVALIFEYDGVVVW